MPPPPPEPPPLPKLGNSTGHGKSNNCEPPPDRNALLGQIRKGARLKKVETNDRSNPIIDGSRSSASNGPAKRNFDSKPNGPVPIIPPGGLFAQGIPKLRPTLPRTGDNAGVSSSVIQSIRSGGTSSVEHLRVGQLGGSRSQPPSPVSKPRQSSGRTINSVEKENLCISSNNTHFPDDVNIKGPAPAPPPQSQKPCFRANVIVTSEASSDAPTKHVMVKRSASQTSLGQRPRLTRPPPGVRPPPPPNPKCAPQVAPPPPPSKPPNILRRQSFGIGENHTSRFASNKLSVVNGSAVTPKLGQKLVGPPPPPPPPPRNNSAPNDLNQMTSTSSPSLHVNRMNIAPPPPPPPNRAVTAPTKSLPARPPAPRAPAPPPPPPPQQRHPAPPSQMKVTPAANLAPPPPTRVSSIRQNSSDFEARFLHMFNGAQKLPKPEKFSNNPKVYPSKINRSRQKQGTRRQPPPPPPQLAASNLQDSNRGQPVLHIQLESGIFSNNFAHC